MNSGQICIAIKRVYVHESIFIKFRDAMIARVKAMKIGDGAADCPLIGPIQNNMQFTKAKGLLDNIKKHQYNVAIVARRDQELGSLSIPPLSTAHPRIA